MSDTYTDLSHTQFPDQVDDSASHEYMSNVSSDVTSLVNQYENYIKINNFSAAKNLLDNNPNLKRCIFTAEDYNWLRDAVIANQRLYSQDIQDVVRAHINKTVGINDSPTSDNAGLVAYSAQKVNSMIQGTDNNVTLAADTWATDSKAAFKYVVTVSGVTQNDDIDVSPSSTMTVEQGKAWAKAMVLSGAQSANKVALYSYGKKPTIDIPITITVHK